MTPRGALIEVVLPVYNEERILAASTGTLRDYLQRHFPFRWRITIADNASTDATWEIASYLAAEHPEEVRALHLDAKGRGLALRTAWGTSDADVVSYMDVDLSTNLDSLLPLVAPLLSGHSDLAVGCRHARGARVVRQAKREVLSRGYNALIRAGFRAPFHDAQCGFKAARTDVVRQLLPLVADNNWFFDTELLLVAQRQGLRIFEIPVTWIEDLDSRVDIAATVLEDLRGLWRVRRSIWSGELTATPSRPTPVGR